MARRSTQRVRRRRPAKASAAPGRALGPPAAAVFFDLGDTLGTAVLSLPPVRLTHFRPNEVTLLHIYNGMRSALSEGVSP